MILLFRRFIAIALVTSSAVAVSAAPASAAGRKFEIKDSNSWSNLHGSISSSRTSATVSGTLVADSTRVTAWGCVSASISGCSLVANQKKLAEYDTRRQGLYAKDFTKTLSKTSGQSVYVRACFTWTQGHGACSGWK
ncbi:hypothetical protein [Kribbella solani]|uniref:hypothetical protein n=1 Tax=Kribbella solani TaxID=236067 RepID=UPI00299FCB91|nr:hypothetical protein [Kribbella solani]MDX2969213.1 hypothetical protein [Kribbella solani]